MELKENIIPVPIKMREIFFLLLAASLLTLNVISKQKGISEGKMYLKSLLQDAGTIALSIIIAIKENRRYKVTGISSFFS